MDELQQSNISIFSSRKRRFFATSIDYVIISIIGIILGKIFSPLLISLPVFISRAFGLIILITYFGILNSNFFNGKTIGKRLFKIKVVEKSGNPVTLKISLLRSSIISIPFYFNNSPTFYIYNFTITMLVLYIFGFILFIPFFINIYLFIFNRKNKQLLHDCICNTYVINDNTDVTVLPTISKIHYKAITIISIFFIIISTSSLLFFKTKYISINNLMDIQIASKHVLYNNTKVIKDAKVTQGNRKERTLFTNNKNSSSKKDSSYNYLLIDLTLDKNTDYSEAEISRYIYKSIVTKYLDVNNLDFVIYNFKVGYDILISKNFQSERFNIKVEK